MSVTFGFYNSSNGDRKYNARQISSIFDGIIQDGIYQNYGNHFEVNDARVVNGTNSMKVYVNTGRAWLNHTWTLNDAILALDVAAADLSNPRIDTVVIEVNESTRSNSIKIVKGTAAASPSAPTLTNTNTVHQYPLANITVRKGVTSISLADITNRIGQASPNGTPFVTGLFAVMSIDSIIAQWGDQWTRWFNGFSEDADVALENLLDQYTNDNDAKLVELLDQALSHCRNLRAFYRAVPTTNGASKTFTSSNQGYSNQHDFMNDIYPSENIQVGDYLVGSNGYIAQITYKTDSGQGSGIYSFTVVGTGVTIVPGASKESPRVLYYLVGGATAELPEIGIQKSLDSQAVSGVSPNTALIEGDILISNTGKVARVLHNPGEWDDQIGDYITVVVGIGNIGSNGVSSQTVYTTLELNSHGILKVKLHNLPYLNGGRYIKVQKLTGRNKNTHRWTDNPVGFAGAKSEEGSPYADIPIPSWMPNSGVLQTSFPVTNDILQNGLTVDVSRWLLDAMKPILLKQTEGQAAPDQTDSLAGFADGSYVALLGEYLVGAKPGRIANSRKYSLDVRYRFILTDANGSVIGTTKDALSIPYRTFWNSRPGVKRHVSMPVDGDPFLTGSYRIVAN